MSSIFEKVDFDLFNLLQNTEPKLFLVGAGISMAPPSSLPSARQMMSAILEFGAPIELKDKLFQITRLRYEYLVELFHNTHDPQYKLITFFETSENPNAFHYFLAERMQKGDWVLTTNFDYLLERAMNYQDQNSEIALTSQDFKKYSDPAKWFKKGIKILYKLHGSRENIKTRENTKDTLVTTLSSLGKSREGEVFSVETWKRDLFEKIGKDRTLIVMGYSGGDDFDIVPMLSRIPELRRVIWIAHDVSHGSEFQVFKIRKINLSQIPLTEQKSFLNQEDELLYNLSLQSRVPEIIKVHGNTTVLIDSVLQDKALVKGDTSQKISPSHWISQAFSPATAESKNLFAAAIFQNYGYWNEALDLYGSLCLVYEKNRDEKNKAYMLSQMGHLYRSLNQMDKAKDSYEKAYPIFESLNESEDLAWIAGNIGLIYRENGDLNKAYELNKKAYDLFKKTKNQQGIANAALTIGYILRDLGRLDKALKYMSESLPIYEKLGDLTNLAWGYANMGVSYVVKKDFKKATELYEKALSMFKKLGNSEGIKNTEIALNSMKSSKI